MNLPHILEKFLQKPEAKREVFLSLIFQSDFIQAGVWHIKEDGSPHMLGTSSHVVSHDTWEERLIAVDGAISTLPSLDGEVAIKVVLGLHVCYLTPSGDIDKNIRVELKKLTQKLHLQPVGFVSLPQALIYAMKKNEGTPPSAIFIGVSGSQLCISLYKIATRVAEQIIDINGTGIAEHIDETLGNFPDAEILPSRMLLYGAQPQDLENVKRELLRYPWQSKPNFMHFPKIESIPTDVLIESVSFAGASELATSMKEEELEPVTSEKNQVMQEAPDIEEHTPPAVTVASKEDIPEENYTEEKESNVVLVDPESLGFSSKKKIESEEEITREEYIRPSVSVRKDEDELETVSDGISVSERARKFIDRIVHALPLSTLTSSVFPVLFVFALLGLGFFLVYWFIPTANVTILEIEKPIAVSSSMNIYPDGGSVDSEKSIIPGKKQEKTLTGEKTIDVSGKKAVGDPAKGTVTIYNKSTTSKVLKKGSVLSSGTLSFTLDEDVSVASASVTTTATREERTFGKSNGSITARAIGGQSNMQENSEFLFKDFTDVVARNERQLSGGTSRDVTVVSRADQETLVKSVSGDLLASAKKELGSEVSGGEVLIEETIRTQVQTKSFQQELDQEATKLSGKVVLNVSGISVSRSDIATVLKPKIESEIPEGYRLGSKEPEASFSGVKIAKDGKISAQVHYTSVSEPVLDMTEILQSIVGKSIRDVQKYLEKKKGIAGVVFDIKRWISTDRLPINRKNIEIRIETQ